MATQKITMGLNGDTDYQAKFFAATNGADAQNSFMWGQQTPVVAANVNPKYGNPNALAMSGMAQPDTNNNQVFTNPAKQTGLLGEFSSTESPQQSPEMMAQNAEARIAGLQNGIQFQGHNNRQQIYGA